MALRGAAFDHGPRAMTNCAHRLACIEAGMDDFISKPVSADHVKSCLERWLRQRNAQNDSSSDAADFAS